MSVEGWGVPYQTKPFLPLGEVTFTIGFRNVDDGIVDRGTKRAIEEVKAVGRRDGLDR